MPDRSLRRPKAYHHGNLRRALVDAASRLIVERGPGGFTLREVARRAGVSHNAPYRHFRDSDAVLAAVAEEGFLELSASIARATAGITAPTEALVAAGVAYVTCALAHPAHYRTMFGTRIETARHPGLQTAANRAFDALVELITRGQQARVFIAGEPRELARVAWSLVHGLADLAIADQFRPGGRRALRRLTRVATRILASGLERGHKLA